MFSSGISRVKLGQRSQEAVWWLGGLAAAHRECWPRSVPGASPRPGRGPPRAAAGAWPGGGREIPLCESRTFFGAEQERIFPGFPGHGLLISRALQAELKGWWPHERQKIGQISCLSSARLSQKTVAALSSTVTLKSWTNVSRQAFAYWVYQGSMWYEE